MVACYRGWTQKAEELLLPLFAYHMLFTWYLVSVVAPLEGTQHQQTGGKIVPGDR